MDRIFEKPDDCGDLRQKLVVFLHSSTHYDATKLLERIKGSFLHTERVILYRFVTTL